MSLQHSLESVNEGSIFVCLCLFSWILLVCVNADGLLILPYWALFLPLWLWKTIVFFGWLVGFCTWIRLRREIVHLSRSSNLVQDDTVLPYIQALSVSVFFTFLISCSEVLLCLHLTVPSLQLSYLTIFTPLLLVGLLGVFGFFFVVMDSRSVLSWTRRRRTTNRQRSRTLSGHSNFVSPEPASRQTARPRRVCTFTLELCIAANLLQLLFLIARLDKWIQSKWLITFIPSFILLGMSLVFCLIGFTVALIRYFTLVFIPIEQRRLAVYYYASHILIVFLLCTSVCLLSLRLDGMLSPEQMTYSFIGSPVLLSLVIYSLNAICLGPGNPWWFGLNRNILLALLEACPILQLCANTSVHTSSLWKLSNGHGANNTGSLTSAAAGAEPTMSRSVSDLSDRSGAEEQNVASTSPAHPSTQTDAYRQQQALHPTQLATVQNQSVQQVNCNPSVAIRNGEKIQPLLQPARAIDVVQLYSAENVRHPD